MTTTNAVKTYSLNDKKNLLHLRAAIEENLAEFCAEYGITVKAGNCKFEADGTNCTFQVKFSAPDSTGAIKSDYEKDFDRHHVLFAHKGLTKEFAGQKVVIAGKWMEFVGLAMKRRKYPIALRDCVSKKIVLHTTSILRLFPAYVPTTVTVVDNLMMRDSDSVTSFVYRAISGQRMTEKGDPSNPRTIGQLRQSFYGSLTPLVEINGVRL